MCFKYIPKLIFIPGILDVQHYLPQAGPEPVYGFLIQGCWRNQVDSVILNKWQKPLIHIRQHLINTHGAIPGIRTEKDHQGDYRQKAVIPIKASQKFPAVWTFSGF